MISAASLPAVLAKTSERLTPVALSPAAGRWNSRPLPLWARGSLAIEVLAAYLAVRCKVSRVELPSLVDALRSGQPSGADDGAQDDALQRDLAFRLGYAVQSLLGRAPGDGPCLVRSLVLTKLLARRRISARLVIGVRSEPSFSAHAWVEHRGQAVLPTDAEHRRLVEL